MSLGRGPSLQRLRRGSRPLVRRLHRYYARVRLLRAVHHRLRLSAFPLRSRRTTRRDDAQPSQVPVSDVHACPELFDTEEPGHDSPIALQPVLPSTGGRVSALQTSWVFGAQSLRPTYPAANASRVTSRRPAHGSRCGVEWLAPSPRGLSPIPSTSSPGRSPPRHPHEGHSEARGAAKGNRTYETRVPAKRTGQLLVSR